IVSWLGWIVLGIIVISALAFIALAYLVVPLVLRRKLFLRAERELSPTQMEDLNDLAREGMRRAVHALRAEGFEVAANFRVAGGPEGSHCVTVLLVNRSAGDYAEGFFVSSQSGDAYNESWTVVIRTE